MVCLSAGLIPGCRTAPGAQEADAGRVEVVEQWRQRRVEDLKRPDGWLSLAGLYWLREGDNRFGSDPGNDLVFPGKAPARLGVFRVDGEGVHMTAAPGVEIRYQDAPVTSIAMDPGGETASVILTWGTLSWFAIERDGDLGIRLRDTESPAFAVFDSLGLDAFPIDLAWHLGARFETYDPPKTVYVPTIQGREAEESVPGAVLFTMAGETQRLDVTGAPGDSAFFVIFGDQTNGQETYGGGRYVWVDAPDEDGAMVIDFNRSYNPPCVFTPYATCPLPPRQNRLPLRVEAGEKTYGQVAVQPGV